MKFSTGWQLQFLKKLIAQEPDILRFTDEPEEWFQNEAISRLEEGKTAEEIFRSMQDASDWAYEYGSL